MLVLCVCLWVGDFNILISADLSQPLTYPKNKEVSYCTHYKEAT